MQPYNFHRGALPLLISVPHAGTQVPEEIASDFTHAALQLPDTDWYVDQLYAFAEPLGASFLRATYSRYVVDLNRSADSAPLYANAPTSPVCPTRTFAGEPIYREGREPDAAGIADRIERYWQPYHQCIAEELWRMRSEHGYALLWDAHSILSRVPTLFEGELPEFNLGTRDDAACPREIAQTLLDTIQVEGRYHADLRISGGSCACRSTRTLSANVYAGSAARLVESESGRERDSDDRSAAQKIPGVRAILSVLSSNCDVSTRSAFDQSALVIVPPWMQPLAALGGGDD